MGFCYDYKDEQGAEVVMRLTCQRCGAQAFRRQIGYGNSDNSIANSHSLYDQFESVPEGWEINHALGGWCCPKCAEEYHLMIEKFMTMTTRQLFENYILSGGKYV